MNQNKRRLARLRASSADIRSQSVTPTGSRSSTPQPSSSRRALITQLINAAEERDIEMPPEVQHRTPKQIRAMVVDNTPGGTLGVTGETVTLQSTPGGHIRRAVDTGPLSSLATSVEERVEALDVSDDDDDEVDDAEARQILRWVQQGPVFLTPKPLSCSSTATGNVGDASGNNSSLSQGTVIQPGSVADVSVADAGVFPSTSGVGKTPRSRVIRKTHEGSDFDSDFDDEFDVDIISNAVAGMGKEIPDNDELDERVQNIVASVESAMDEEAGRLPGVSDSYTWEENFESFRGVPEVFSGPTAGPLKDYDSPYDAFIDIWDRDIMERIAQETNRYAQQTISGLRLEEGLKPSSRLHRWTDTDADELMVLFAIYMFMGIDQRTSQNEYWESENVLEMPRFKNIMTFNRYVLLSKFLHFVDNSDASRDYLQCEGIELSPKLAKLAPVISHLNKKFASLYNLHREISIDESLTLFKGRLSWVQAIRSKAARFGIKSYELCESHTGYLYKFQIYAGKGSSSDGVDVPPAIDLAGKSTQVVLELLRGLENRGHSVTMDNFYNCPALARYLKSLGYDCLGTLRTNRRNVPSEIAKVPKNVPKGSIIARHSGDVSIVTWKDSKLVTMISTYHNADTYVGSKAGKTLVKPISVRDYNNTMGGVDLKDQKLSMYLLERKRCVKWYVKMFKRLLNVSIHNAFVMYVASLKRRDMPAVTHRDFRKKLANTLWERHRSAPVEICEPDGKIMRLRRDVAHVPQVLTKQGERELVEFLTEEIVAERKAQKVKQLPTELEGFAVKSDGAEVTLTKKLNDESIVITFNVNHTVDSEELGDEQQPEKQEFAEMRSRPQFEVDIVRAGTTLGFTCSFLQEQPTSDEYNDVFGIDEVTLYKGEWNDKVYAVAGDVLDGYLYDLLMNLLEEKGVSNEFVQKLSDFSTAYEHSAYINLLESLSKFTIGK